MIILKTIGDWSLCYKNKDREINQYVSPADDDYPLTLEAFKTCPFLDYIFTDNVKINAIIIKGSTLSNTRTPDSDYDLCVLIENNTLPPEPDYLFLYHGHIVHWFYNNWDKWTDAHYLSAYKANGLCQFYFLKDEHILYVADDWRDQYNILKANKMLLVKMGIFWTYNKIFSGLCSIYIESNLDQERISKIHFKKFYYYIVIINSIINNVKLDTEFAKRIKEFRYQMPSNADLKTLLDIVIQYDKKMKELLPKLDINQLSKEWLALNKK